MLSTIYDVSFFAHFRLSYFFHLISFNVISRINRFQISTDPETRVFLAESKDFVILACKVLIVLHGVTDRETDERICPVA